MGKLTDDKRGQIGPTTIVGIVLVVGAVILGLLFYFGIFGNNDLEERDLCKLSIVSRATLPGVTNQVVPLNCYTEKICITTNDVPKDSNQGTPQTSPFAIFGDKKSDCAQFAGEKNVKDVYVRINDKLADQIETKKTIEKLYADNMYNCWTMTGQGKLDVFRGETNGGTATISAGFLELTGSSLGELIKEIKPKCLVCSRIALSDKLTKADKSLKESVIAQLDFNKYLATEKVSDGSGLTYLQKFTDEGARGFAGTDKVEFDKVNVGNTIGSNQIALIFMQIKTNKSPGEIGSEAAFLTGTALVGGALFTGTGRSIVFSGPAAFLTSIVVGLGATGGAYLYASSAQESNQAVSLASCRSYTNEKDAKLGCSLIKPVKWDVNEVNNLCSGGIAGNL